MDGEKHSKSCVENTGGYVRDCKPAGLHRVLLVPREWVERHVREVERTGEATVSINIPGVSRQEDVS